MREAIGSTFIFKLMIFFIFFFAAFLSIAVNYSQSFRIKNKIINFIEQQEGLANSRDRIVEFVSSVGYYRDVSCDSKPDEYGSAVWKSDHSTKAIGVCVLPMTVPRHGGRIDKYYKVTTFVSFDFPIIGRLITFPIVGETKVVTNARD